MKIARTIILTLLILGVAVVLILRHQGASGESVAAQAIAGAEKQVKPAWLFVHTADDPTCMAVETLFNNLQTEFAGKIVFINVDFSNPAERGLIKKYKVTAVPTSIFFDGNGKAVDRKVGPKRPDEYRDTLAQLLEIS